MLSRIRRFVQRQRSELVNLLNRKVTRVTLAVLAVMAIFGLCATASAASVSSGIALSSIASHVQDTVKYFSSILSDIALVAGIGFVLAALFKFHQHKQNPTQVPISQGVTLLIVGSALLIFPYILTTAKSAVFGSASVANLTGSDISTIIGSS